MVLIYPQEWYSMDNVRFSTLLPCALVLSSRESGTTSVVRESYSVSLAVQSLTSLVRWPGKVPISSNRDGRFVYSNPCQQADHWLISARSFSCQKIRAFGRYHHMLVNTSTLEDKSWYFGSDPAPSASVGFFPLTLMSFHENNLIKFSGTCLHK